METAELRYRPDAEHRALADALEGALTELLPITRAHAGGCESDATWRQLQDLGILSAGVPEARGGAGLGVTERVLMAMTMGRALASPAVLATMAVLPAALDVVGGAGQPRLAAGIPGSDPVWVDAPGAELVLMRSKGEAALHRTPRNSHMVDANSWGVRLCRGDLGAAVRALDPGEVRILRLIDSAALAGIAAATLDMAVAYARVREQFGRAIGSFQAVKHHCANMAIAASAAADLVGFAAVAVDSDRDDAPRAVESAFLVAARAAIDNAGLNIQIHGGIGFSAEAEPHLFLKRARLIAALGGGVEAAAGRVCASRRAERDIPASEGQR